MAKFFKAIAAFFSSLFAPKYPEPAPAPVIPIKPPAPTPVPTPEPKPAAALFPKSPYTAAQIAMTAKLCGVKIRQVEKAQWMVFMAVHNGWNERNNDRQLADLLWPNTNYDDGMKYHTVSGRSFSWCKATTNTAYVVVGVSIVGHLSAGAVDGRTFGVSCGYVFGALIPITHADGTHHIGYFVRWLDEDKKIALIFSGNHLNELCISEYNLSGNVHKHDEVIPGPRWPKEFAYLLELP